MSWNARSLVKVNKDLVLDYCIKNNIDAFCIQETYLKPYINPSLRDYKIVRLDRWNKERGGVIIGINKEINYTPLYLSMQEDYQMEVVGCKLYLKNRVKLNIFNIYIPDSNLLLSDRGLEKITDTVPGGEKVLIIGDLNAHNGLWCGYGNDNRNGKTTYEFLMKNSDICLLTPKDLPTRINSRTGRSVTIGSASLASKVSITSDKESTLYSDHFPILVEISQDNSIYENYEESSKVNLKKINWEAFKNKLQETDVQSRVNCYEDVNGKIETFQNSLLEIAQELAPKSERAPIHRELSVWWNNECTIAKKQLLEARRRYRQLPNFENFLMCQRRYAAFRRQTLEAKKHSYREFLEKLDFRQPASRVFQR